MRIVLVDNLVMPDVQDLGLLDVYPHLGLISLAAVAQREGHQVSVYDPKRAVRLGHIPYNADLYETVACELMRGQPDTIGFTALGASFIFALNVAREIKRREADMPILLGGPHAT